ncbi:MAG: acyl-CoA dehydrogenase family protein, partial [Rhodococcus sp. (in: high G+C Gram-positive bacteria)]|nr:acyl-CoA dehydrogenase family protein [Rhodococcus sp. (in: high G+C Gram-positive bacteria)]MDX5454638.1 acyl-CoA dehydrogenase family protein [Rhodococcus sp. (in: high G+C Gram-positive bacteria)]
MTIGLTDEDRDLRDAVRGWAARHVTADVVRQAVEAKTDTRPAYWDSLAELGVLGLHLPEEAGGAGCGLVELAVVTEELGRSMVPGPFLPTVLTAAVLREARRTAELAGLADGTTLAGVALDPGTLRVGRGSAGTTLSGRSGFVLGGHTADLLLVAAEDAGNRAWVLLHRDRVDVEDLPSHDVVRGNSQFEVDRLALG